jgi:PilZ domain-containing protein
MARDPFRGRAKVDTTLGEEPAAELPGGDAPREKRREGRKAFLKRAQVVFEGAGIDCVVENLSGGGARVRFGNPIPLPDVLALRFPDGTSHPAERRWARGEAAGLEFSGSGPAAEAERRHLSRAVQDAVAAADPAEVVRLLRQVWFFGDENLRRAVEALEVARARFVAALDPHVASRPAPPPKGGAGT